MNARADFLKVTGWEGDYVGRDQRLAQIVGYRGPFPAGRDELEATRSALAPLFPAAGAAQLNGLLHMVTTADRLLVAWRPDGAAGVLAARRVEVDGLTGHHLTVVAVDPELRGKGLLPEMVRVLAAEEPVDVLSVITNEEAVYRAVASTCPGGMAYPTAAGRHHPPVRAVAEGVLAQLPGTASLPPLGPDLTWRGLLGRPDQPAEPLTGPADRRSRFVTSLKLTTADAALVVGDLSGVLGAPARASAGLLAVGSELRLRNVTVTGTNGKTSTVEFGRQLNQAAGLRAASFGTLGAITPRGRTRSPRMGTGRRAMPQFADRMWALGYDVLWSEGYSYALSRALFDHLPVDVAVFTQLGFDHLSMHRTLAGYWAAKERLFRAIVRPGGTVVLDPSAEGAARILAITDQRGLEVITTGAGHHVELSATGLRVGGRTYRATVPVTEGVMMANLELAVGASLALGLEPPTLARALSEVVSPPGRFQILDAGTPYQVVIDSAHNGDALEAALGEWRHQTEGRLLVVVASVGSSDPGRWEPIGEVAHVLADVVVVTDESPYEGDADRIRAAILRGCPRGVEIPDRRQAIEWVIDQAQPGDTVVVTGRADEDFLVDEHGRVTYPTDTELVSSAINR